jgi:hypothetical protein
VNFAVRFMRRTIWVISARLASSLNSRGHTVWPWDGRLLDVAKFNETLCPSIIEIDHPAHSHSAPTGIHVLLRG